ncbi:hypothetical protein TrRE_jg10536 [Triparma retinervis]|uniref:Uncharacterized protein n=1 Tax=Triparma retinervis TaxID=2557542 RepID=A0A9W7APU5_9STRA|nr:hypothetical protein TrRE_jg10536 [Triparma retinervis]
MDLIASTSGSESCDLCNQSSNHSSENLNPRSVSRIFPERSSALSNSSPEWDNLSVHALEVGTSMTTCSGSPPDRNAALQSPKFTSPKGTNGLGGRGLGRNGKGEGSAFEKHNSNPPKKSFTYSSPSPPTLGKRKFNHYSTGFISSTASLLPNNPLPNNPCVASFSAADPGPRRVHVPTPMSTPQQLISPQKREQGKLER